MTTDKTTILKRFLSLILALSMTLGFITIPTVPARAASAQIVTEEDVLALIELYKFGKEPGEKAKAAGITSYTDGSYYDPKNPTYRIVLPDGPINGIDCAKFAFAFFDDIFGSDTPIRKVTNAADIRVGDVIHFSGHWSVVTSIPEYNQSHNVYVASTVGGGPSGVIGWGNSKVNINNDVEAYYTRYPSTWKFSDSEKVFEITDEIGTPLSSLNELPSTVNLSATKDGDSQSFNLPIIWDEKRDYNEWQSGEQTIYGQLDISGYPELADSKLPTIKAIITLKGEAGITDVSVEQLKLVNAKAGTSWNELNIPTRLDVTITYGDGKSEKVSVGIQWKTSEYDSSAAGGGQTVHGDILIDVLSGALNKSENSTWADKIKEAGTEITIVLSDSVGDMTIEGEPFEANGYFGDTFDKLSNVPQRVTVYVQYGSGEQRERIAIVNWDTSSYDPLKPTQTITGKLNFSGYVEEFPETTITLTITLTQNPNDAVERIELISPQLVNGTKGVPFAEQSFPETVQVRIVYASGAKAEVTANVTWTDNGFDPDMSGLQDLTGRLSFSNGEVPANTSPDKLTITVPVSVQTRGVSATLDEIAPIYGFKGDDVKVLQAKAPSPLQVTITNSDNSTYVMSVPVNWDWSTFDSSLDEQVIHGTVYLDIYDYLPSPDVQLTVYLSDKPTYATDYEKTYDGKNTPLPVEKPEGCAGVSITYSGTTLAGQKITNSQNPPSEAGNYTATVTLAMASGYDALASLTVNYNINPVVREFTTPVQIAYTMNNNFAVVSVEGAEYRIEPGGGWQDSPVFSGLKPDTTYTVYQRLKESADKNYAASAETSAQVTTQSSATTAITIPFTPKFVSKTYDGVGLLDGLSNGKYSLSIGGSSTVSVTVTAYKAELCDPSENPYDYTDKVENPIYAGSYVIQYSLPSGYVWDTGSQTFTYGLWIYPDFGAIYVDDTYNDIEIKGSADSTSDGYTFTVPATGADSSNFNTGSVGESTILITVSNGTIQQNLRFPVNVLPWTITSKDTPVVKIANDEEFDDSKLPATISVTAQARGKEQTFEVPVEWDTSEYEEDKDTQTIPGTLDFSSVGALKGTDDTSASAVVTRLAAPVYIPFEAMFESKVYDGTGLFDDGKDYSVSVDDAEIPVQVTAYLASGEEASEQAEGNPAAAGKYVIRAELPDNYYWDNPASHTKDIVIWIYPAVSPIYVGDTLENVTLITGNGDYAFTMGENDGFSSEMSGETTISVIATGLGSPETIEMPVTVLPWNVVKKDAVEATGKFGTEFSSLDLPDTVTVTAQGSGDEREFQVPVIWNDDDYDEFADTQTINGALDFSSIPELAGTMDTEVTAVLHLGMNEIEAPEISDFVKTYDTESTPLIMPELPKGIVSNSISYSGMSFAGEEYEASESAPVNAGTYTATVSYVMESGYAQLPDAEVSYTINKAPQDPPTEIKTILVYYDSIVLKPVEGAEYSKDGIVWQSSSSFSDLTANTSYTMYVRIAATADGNYAESEAISMEVVTSQRDAQTPTLNAQTVTYNGNPQGYEVGAITGVRNIVISYMQDGAPVDGTPINAGVYDVSISFEMEAGYKQLAAMASTFTILKASQNAPKAAVIDATDTTLTISNLEGAEYSTSGSDSWQSSNVFTDLSRDTTYTILVRMAEDMNHEASPVTEVTGRTKATTSEIPLILPAQTETYDGTAKEYTAASQLTEIEGVRSITVAYIGTTNADVPYRSTTPPTEAGRYAIAISLTAEDGYTLSHSMIHTTLTIERAPQFLEEEPTIARVTTATVTVNPIAGAEYSGNSGASWQTSNSFTGLAPETSFIILVRLAETPNYLASNEKSLSAQTLADTGLDYEIDFRNETISFTEGVVEMSMTGFFTELVESGSAVRPGLMMFARLVDDGSGEPGTAIMVQIPARPSVPNVSFNAATYTINTTTAMEYSTDDGESWATCDDNMDVSFLGASILKIRYAATDDSFRSDAKDVFVPSRAGAPALTINMKTERIDTTSAMEYSADGGKSWIPCVPDMSVSTLTGETIMVRTKATSVSPASSSAFLVIPERADIPDYTILMSEEALTADAPFEYNLNGVWTETEELDLSDLCGQAILIQTAAGDGKFASNRISVQVPLRGEPPAIEVNEAALTINTTLDMEYSTDNGFTWIPATVDMDISGYVGETILVRRSVTDTMFVSASVAVRILALPSAPEISVDMKKETVNTTVEMEYSTDEGKTWTPAPDDLDVSSLTGSTIEIRMKGTDDQFPSESATVEIPERNEAPEVTVDLSSGTISAPAGTEYSTDGGETWQEAPSKIDDSMCGETLLFRTPSDETHFASINVPVALPARPDGPVVSFDMNTMTVNTTSDMEYSTDGGQTWNPAPDGLDVSGLTGKTIEVRYPATDDVPASSSTSIDIPMGASAPIITVDCMTEQLIASESTLEWSRDNGKSWTACKTPMNVGDYAGQMILFRVPGTTDTPASPSVPVTIPSRETIPDVDVDISSETVNTTVAMEYSLNGGLSWTSAPMNMDVSDMTGSAVLVRNAHTETTFASLAVSVTIPVRAASVAVSVDMEKETVDTAPGMDYSLNGGKDWVAAPADLDVSSMTGSVVLVRNHGTGFQFASEATSVAIPIRRDAPSVSADLRNGLFSVPDGVQFSSDSGKTWAEVPAAITNEMLNTTVLFRFPANENYFASIPVSVTLPSRPDGPTLSVDRQTMTVNTTSDMEYLVNGAWIPAPANMDVIAFQGQEMQFRYAATADAPASSITTLQIPEVTPVPALSLNATEETIVSKDGKENLEYSTDNGDTWIACTMPMDIGDFAGMELWFRTPADGENPCSAPVVAHIPARADTPEAFLDMETEIVVTNPDTGIAFSEDNGKTWSDLYGELVASNLEGETILVRVACTSENLASEPVAVTIPARKDAPAVSVNMSEETIGTDSSMEISLDGGRTWVAADDNMDVSGMTGVNVMVRYSFTDTAFHSNHTIVAIPSRQRAPEVSVDMRNGTINAPAGVEFSHDNGKTWGRVPNAITSDMYGTTVMFRFPATDKYFASKETVIVLSATVDGPALQIDYENLTVNTDATMEYSIDNGAAWHKGVKNMSITGLLGKTLLVRYSATSYAPASSSTVLVIPTRGSAPVVTVYNASAINRNDGIITGTRAGMEYRRVGASAWLKVTGTSIGHLSAGSYEIRYAATENSLASESCIVVVYADNYTGGGNWNPNYPSRPSNPGPSSGNSSSNAGGSGSSNSSSSNKSYTVKFETNGGSTIMSQTIDKDGKVEEPAVPTREGFTFMGWFTDADKTKPYDFDKKVTSSFTLYAKWEKSYINAPGASVVDDGPSYVESEPIPSTPPMNTQVSLMNGDSGISYVNGRSEGRFEPNASITRGEVAAIIFRLMSEEAKAVYYSNVNVFSDVESSAWYNESISTLVNAGVLSGYTDGTFRPNQAVTRAELASILVRVQGRPEMSGGAVFTDTSGHWAEGYISSAVSSGVVYGYEDGSFKPNRSITRAESVSMINRMLMRSAMDSSEMASVTFVDVQPSDWFYGDVMAAANSCYD